MASRMNPRLLLVTPLLGASLATASPDPPQLRIAPLPSDGLQLAWPRAAEGYLVERAVQLGRDARWRVIPELPAQGPLSYLLAIDPELPESYFRLRFALTPCPSPETLAPLSDLKIAEVAVIPEPGGYPWIELRHTGRCGPVELGNLELRNGRGEVLVTMDDLDWNAAVLVPGQLVVIVFDDPQTGGWRLPDEWLGDPENPSGWKAHWLADPALFDPVRDACVLAWADWARPDIEQVVDSVEWGDGAERGNRAYGGSVYQDQIAWHVWGSSAGGPINPALRLGHGLGIDESRLAETLQWALGGTTVRTFPKSFMTPQLYKGWTDEGRVFLVQAQVAAKLPLIPLLEILVPRILVSGGCTLNGNDFATFQARCIDVTMGGSAMTLPWSAVTAAIVPDDAPGAASNQALASGDAAAGDVESDADADGLVDLDETLRFGTDPQNADTDGDAVSDKTEVYSYRFGKGIVAREADIDGDGLRAELDADTDNNGCPDGEEDRNRNGRFSLGAITINGTTETSALHEQGETDPFWPHDEVALSLHIDKSKLLFGECATVTVELLQQDGEPWDEADLPTVTLTCEPADNPKTWEIRLLDSGQPTYSKYPFPPYLLIRLRGGDRVIRVPLVWWYTCDETVHREWSVEFQPGETVIEGGEAVVYRRPIRREFAAVDAWFLFGDGDRNWEDPQPSAWPAQQHTGVGFIPTGTVMGIPVPTEEWTDPYQSEDAIEIQKRGLTPPVHEILMLVE